LGGRCGDAAFELAATQQITCCFPLVYWLFLWWHNITTFDLQHNRDKQPIKLTFLTLDRDS
jgi:hypothetical protein